MNRYFPPKCVLFILSGQGIHRVPFTWDVTDLQVVPLQDINPLPDPGIDTRLVWEVTERSMVRLDDHGVGSPTIVLPLG